MSSCCARCGVGGDKGAGWDERVSMSLVVTRSSNEGRALSRGRRPSMHYPEMSECADAAEEMEDTVPLDCWRCRPLHRRTSPMELGG